MANKSRSALTILGIVIGISSIIMVMSIVGIYAVNTRLFDAGVAIAMGLVGYVLLRLQWPIVNLVMGVVLGEIVENRLRQTLSLSEGDLSILFTRPITLGILLATGLTVLLTLASDRRKNAGGRG